jgi:hypothetical protein
MVEVVQVKANLLGVVRRVVVPKRTALEVTPLRLR